MVSMTMDNSDDPYYMILFVVAGESRKIFQLSWLSGWAALSFC